MVVVDCDSGHGDAFAIMVADVELLVVSAVAGDQTLGRTTRTAR